MSLVDLVMPKMGESIMEATILKWYKKPGDAVKQDETVLDIATDKVDSEVPSTAEGIIAEILFNVNDVVPVGAVLARIQTNAQATINTPVQATPVQSVVVQEAVYEQVPENIPYQPAAVPAVAVQNTGGAKFYSPLVLRIAQEEGLSLNELENIPGTGQDGRVSKKDVLAYLENKTSLPMPRQTAPAVQVTAAPVQQQAAEQQVAKITGNVEIVEMDRMRKLIAKHMVDSKHTSPHVTSFTEADVTNLVLWRDRVKKDFEKRENTKITFTPLFIEAIIKCIKRFPLINSSLQGDSIVIKKDINIGMATALPSGNLIVPVIKNADQLNLVGLSKQVNTLADNARNNKLKPDDTSNGTFTFTNVGTFGSLMGTPIINQPQVAILAVGAIKKRPVVIETEQGDSIAIRHMMYLSMSYDHRIIDGSLGATFLTAVAKELEAWDSNREI
jgi:2-oxoglutarate dehydrogenase E2 component (dihydrolipoamide succinyltransferase)